MDAQQLRTTTDVDQARAAIAKMTGRHLREIADQLGIHLYGTVARQRTQLLHWAVERRLDAATISGIH